MSCGNAAKTRKQLKFGGVLQTTGSISAASGPKFTILWGHVEDILLLNIVFRLSIYALVAKIWPDKVVRWFTDGNFWRLFAFCIFEDPRVSHLHFKFALRPHHLRKYGRHPICGRLRLGEEKKRKKKEQTTGWKYNGLSYSIGRP